MQKGRVARQNQGFARSIMEADPAQTNKDPVCGAVLHLQRYDSASAAAAAATAVAPAGAITDAVVSEVAVGKECLYPGHCTFAYCQEEIDVWTLERKGFISRELLFDPYGHHSNARLTVPKILQEHHGIFMFLCGVSISSNTPVSDLCSRRLLVAASCFILSWGKGGGDYPRHPVAN